MNNALIEFSTTENDLTISTIFNSLYFKLKKQTFHYQLECMNNP
jgi:hypothetical protein